ncbi:MAG: hypothetical protein WB554_01095 [Desulfomonilaceae bacterium]
MKSYLNRLGDQYHITANFATRYKMGGQKCLEELLQIDPQAKVLIATGVSSNNQQTSLMIDFGAKTVIHKPYDIDLLLMTVRDILDRD